MLRNFLKIALRNLSKSRGFTAINVIGLAGGLAVCLLIVLYITDEWSYDRYNANADHIYRIDADINFNNNEFAVSETPRLMGPTLVSNFPVIRQMTRLRNYGDIVIRRGADRIIGHGAVFADSTIFKVFTLPFIQGDPNTCLNNPNSVVIDESTARRYFNSANVVGRTLETGDDRTLLTITGVMRDMPDESHLHLHFIRPIGNGDDSWLSNNYTTYILTQAGAGRAQLQKDVDETVHKYVDRELQAMFHASTTDLEHGNTHYRYPLMPLTNIHLHSAKIGDLEANSNINYVYTFGGIAVLILLIACVNFMNLSTARSANRAREVGIRKVAGSTRRHLIAQFLTESVLVSLFSLLLALGIAIALLPFFNQLAGKQLSAGMLFSIRYLPFLVVLILVVGLLAGSYPAFYLSSFQPIVVLRGKVAAGFKNSVLRNILVVAQFAISVFLIVCTIVIYRQLEFMHNREVGFDRNRVLIIHNTDLLGGTAQDLGNEIQTLDNQLLTLPGVTNVTATADLPTVGNDRYGQNGWFPNASLNAKQIMICATLYVDQHYIPTMGMQLASGRNFDFTRFPSDSNAILINESCAATLGLKDPLNHLLYVPGNDMKSALAFHIVGVVRDFNYNSMREKIHPLIMEPGTNFGTIAIRYGTADVAGLIRQIGAKWRGIKEGVPFDYTFMDTDFDKLYHRDRQTGKIYITFAMLAILIACLGLFGLVTYAAEQRMKEIGIRKVLGARVVAIVALLSKDFARLVGIAALIGFPLAGLFMYSWLNGFAYRTTLTWWIFAVAGAMALSIALLTVSIRTIGAALANPIRSLRSE